MRVWGHRSEAPDLGNVIQCSLLPRETPYPSMTAVEVYIGAGPSADLTKVAAKVRYHYSYIDTTIYSTITWVL